MRFEDVADECTRASDEERVTFPEVVAALARAGVERYNADLQRSERTYYTADGASHRTRSHTVDAAIAREFSGVGVDAAVRASQAGEIKYREFCRRIAAAGCVSYTVSLSGKRAVYYGRTGEAHVEPFPV